MSHQICLRLPLLCFMIFSMIFGREQDPHQGHDHLNHHDQGQDHQVHPASYEHGHAHEDYYNNLQQPHDTPSQQGIDEKNIPESDNNPVDAAMDMNWQDTLEPAATSAKALPDVAGVTVTENIILPDHGPHGHDNDAHHADFQGEQGNENLEKSEQGHTEMHEHPPKVNPLLGNQDTKCEREAQDQVDQKPSEGYDSGSYSFRDSFLLAVRHLSSTLLGFLPEHLLYTILDVNDAVVFTGIIALTLVSIFVPYYFVEAFLSVRPLKKKVTDLNKTLWKVSTAYENQQEEYDIYKEKALAYDEDKNQLDQLETQLHLVRQIEAKLRTENRALQKRINKDVKVAEELESLITTTINERDQVISERDKLKLGLGSLQIKLQEMGEQLELGRTEEALKQMDLELMTHANENLQRRGIALEKEMNELRLKLNGEIDLRRDLETQNEILVTEKNSNTEDLLDLKSVLHKYEETVNNLNDEISVKESELAALKETLEEDSPLVDIAELLGKFKMAESLASSLQARVESLTFENSSLNRDLEKAKEELVTLKLDKDQAETRLVVLESYFKEKEKELRHLVEKQEIEKEMRGKDKDELMQMIEEKNEAIRDMSDRLEKMKIEFEDTRLNHRNAIRALEAKGHETWLSLCQSERKAQEVRTEAELLRQKLTAVAKAKDGHDPQSPNGDVPYIFSQLDMDDTPLPLPEESAFPSYFGLGDFEPPLPLGDEDDLDNEIFDTEIETGRLSPQVKSEDTTVDYKRSPQGDRKAPYNLRIRSKSHVLKKDTLDKPLSSTLMSKLMPKASTSQVFSKPEVKEEPESEDPSDKSGDEDEDLDLPGNGLQELKKTRDLKREESRKILELVLENVDLTEVHPYGSQRLWDAVYDDLKPLIKKNEFRAWKEKTVRKHGFEMLPEYLLAHEYRCWDKAKNPTHQGRWTYISEEVQGQTMHERLDLYKVYLRERAHYQKFKPDFPA